VSSFVLTFSSYFSPVFTDTNYACECSDLFSSLSLVFRRVSPLQTDPLSFLPSFSFPGSDLILNTTSTNLNLTYVGAPIISPGFPTLPPSLHLLNPWGGLLSTSDFFDQISRSIALVGVGDPPLSPSPYDALCRGTPFINPILEWDLNAPEDRTKWVSQQRTLKHFDAPYVYNVFRGDGDGFEKALRDAREKPFKGR